MAIKYRNKVTGREVVVDEPAEFEAKLGKVRRRGRALAPARIRRRKKNRQRLIEKMDDSWKWERTSGGTDTSADDGDGLDKLTVAELVERLDAAGLDKGGSKSEKVARLRDHANA